MWPKFLSAWWKMATLAAGKGWCKFLQRSLKTRGHSCHGWEKHSKLVASWWCELFKARWRRQALALGDGLQKIFFCVVSLQVMSSWKSEKWHSSGLCLQFSMRLRRIDNFWWGDLNYAVFRSHLTEQFACVALALANTNCRDLKMLVWLCGAGMLGYRKFEIVMLLYRRAAFCSCVRTVICLEGELTQHLFSRKAALAKLLSQMKKDSESLQILKCDMLGRRTTANW